LAGLGYFGERIAARRGPVVQCRMGFSDPARMLAGLRAVRDAGVDAVGTITLDSFTRTGHLRRAREHVLRATPLNGYPLLAHGAARTRELIAEFDPRAFPIQLRHGSARPYGIFQEMLAAGITATEGGPVSYCLPYSREPLTEAVTEWTRACQLLAAYDGPGAPVHLETFGGCMLGQLCPPGMLVALAILEGLFFIQHGVRSISLSLAQQTNSTQDAAALWALRLLAHERLGAAHWHVTVYTYMGAYPETHSGALALLGESARLTAGTGSERLIVKTVAEAFRIPTVEENVAALRWAASAAAAPFGVSAVGDEEDDDQREIYHEARTLIDAVLDGHTSVGAALVAAFRRGLLDVPYCLHPDNANAARSVVDPSGRVRWAATGGMPISPRSPARGAPISADGLLAMLHHNRRRFDGSGTASGDTARQPVNANQKGGPS
jgi:methylaspartate mutase epsilon subunit